MEVEETKKEPITFKHWIDTQMEDKIKKELNKDLSEYFAPGKHKINTLIKSGEQNYTIWHGYKYLSEFYYYELYRKNASKTYFVQYNIILNLTNPEGNIDTPNLDKIAHLINNMGTKQLIYIPTNIKYSKDLYNLEKDLGHANLMIYRKKENILEYFEPHGLLTDVLIKNHLNTFLNALNDKLNIKIDKEIQDVYVACNLGFQQIEIESKYQKDEENGYCQAWVLFIIKYVLKFPELNTSEIVRAIQKHLKDKYSKKTSFSIKKGYGYGNGKKTSSSRLKDAYLYLIRGFVFDIQQRVLKLINKYNQKYPTIRIHYNEGFNNEDFNVKTGPFTLDDLYDSRYVIFFKLLYNLALVDNDKNNVDYSISSASDWSVTPDDGNIKIGEDKQILTTEKMSEQKLNNYEQQEQLNDNNGQSKTRLRRTEALLRKYGLQDKSNYGESKDSYNKRSRSRSRSRSSSHETKRTKGGKNTKRKRKTKKLYK
jgi:hypothetical protein